MARPRPGPDGSGPCRPRCAACSIWIDAGSSDEWFLDLGAAAFQSALGAIGITEPVVHYELFEGTHADIEYRYPMAIGWLADRISP